MAGLKLGPLPKQRTVRLTIDLPESLKEELDAYAAQHTREYNEPVETKALIPHILETFLRTDRLWSASRRQKGQEQTGQRRGRMASDGAAGEEVEGK